MPLTEQDLARRRQFVTATDVPAILGVSPWANSADVFFHKTQGIAPKTNPAMECGTLLEPKVLEWAGKALGELLPGDWRVSDNGINAASLDAMTLAGEPVEAKTTGIVGPGTPHQWGEEGSDQIPDYVLIQVQAQLFVTAQRRAWVPALIGGRGFALFQVRANDDLHELIARVSIEFWTRHIQEREPPPRVTASLDTLKRIIRQPNKCVELADELALKFNAAKAVKKTAEEEYETAQAALLEAMGDAEAAKWSGGTYSYFEQHRKAYSVAESTCRVLRHKESKSRELATT